jgi:ubiquinone/menaquinone biosynthesis C-methylase UbiE
MAPAEVRRMSDAQDAYILGRTEAEYARLRMQAKFWEAVTEAVLRRAGAGPGMRCLDAGCGPGEAMRLLGRLVGREGHVTGLDIDAALGAHMLDALHREEGPQFAFVRADLTRGEEVAGAPFDLVFARLLLIHMVDPVGAVRALARLVRPGGKLVLMDYDLSRMACRPEEPTTARAFEIVAGCFTRSGKHADCGLRLASYLIEAGLPMPEPGMVDTFYGPISGRGPMVRAVLASLVPAASALGVASPEEIADIQAGIEALERANRHFALGPLMIGVWTTVPGSDAQSGGIA